MTTLELLALHLFNNCIANGGWVPETSRSFHYWQPAPRWRPLPWLANPGNPAMSPHAEGRTGTRHTGKQWKEREGRGGTSLRTCSHTKTLTVNTIPVMAANTSQSEHTWKPGACTYQHTADQQRNADALCC